MSVPCYYPDTIVAIATPPQNGAIGIIRISGPKAREALDLIFIRHNKRREQDLPRHFYLGGVHGSEGVLVDHALAVCMPGPHSFTGEDVVEIHCHGNQIILRSVVNELLHLPESLKIRAAEPGEFTKRAFLNGKMDLTQAEAVHEIITATSDQALKTSLANLDGKLSEIVGSARQELCETLALVEAGFEFLDEEEISTYDPKNMLQRVDKIQTALSALAKAYTTSKLYDHGVSVAIVGPPNVGKSSLLNALLVEDRAIVDHSPGTTRDIVEGARIIHGIRFVFKDTAGIRAAIDSVETEGVRRSIMAAKKSDIVLRVFDDKNAETTLESQLPVDGLLLNVLNKADLLSIQDKARLSSETPTCFDCLVSSKTRDGIQDMENLISNKINAHYSVQNNVHINQRQFVKIDAALQNIIKIKALFQSKPIQEELVAEVFRSTIRFLDEIVGSLSAEDVLDEIFGKFCVGK